MKQFKGVVYILIGLVLGTGLQGAGTATPPGEQQHDGRHRRGQRDALTGTLQETSSYQYLE